MIRGKVIKFGYEDILISGLGFKSSITFKDIHSEKVIQLRLEIEECLQLIHKLRQVSKNNPTVQYKGFVLDFTEFRQESVDVVIRQLHNLIASMMTYLAC